MVLRSTNFVLIGKLTILMATLLAKNTTKFAAELFAKKRLRKIVPKRIDGTSYEVESRGTYLRMESRTAHRDDGGRPVYLGMPRNGERVC